MQAYQVSMPASFANGSSYVEFPYVKAKYPVGQALTTYFMAPPSFFAGSAEPQFTNDWIGIYPVGYTSLSQYVAKKMVKPEYFGRYTPFGHQYGEFEFEPEYFQSSFIPGKQYHFVYVKNGQSVHGISKPFTFVPAGELYETELYPTPYKQYDWMTSTFMGERPLKTVIAEVHEMFDEHVHLESAHRYLDQLAMYTHLKSYEHHIVSFLKHEQAIKDFIQAQKIDYFSKKVYEIIKMSPERISQSPEFYIRKYEQLMMDKIAMQVRHFTHLRQAIFKSELKLKELQLAETQFYKQFSHTFKSKIAGFESSVDFGSPLAHTKLREHFKYLTSSLWNEMAETKHTFYTTQQHIMHFITDVYSALESIYTAPEWTEVYTKFGIPTVSAYNSSCYYPYYPYYFNYTPQVETGVHRQLESYQQTITSLKYKLAMLHTQGQLVFDAEFFKPILQAIGEFESGILYEKSTFLTHLPSYAPWFGERMSKIYKYKQYFETVLGEKSFDEYKLQMALWHLRELQTELYQFVHFFKYTYPTSAKTVYAGKYVQLVEALQGVINEKCTYMTSVYDRMPIEYVFTYGKFGAWKEILEAEKQAVALKSTMIVKEQLKQLYTRLYAIEKFASLKQYTTYFEKLAVLKDLFDIKTFNYPVYSTKTYAPFYHYQEMFYQFYKLIHETETALWLSSTPSTKFEFVFDRLLTCEPIKYFKTVYGTSDDYKYFGSMPSTYETYGPEYTKTVYPSSYASCYPTIPTYYPTKSKAFYEDGFYSPMYKYPFNETSVMPYAPSEYYPVKPFEYVPEMYGCLYNGFETLSMNDTYTPVKPTFTGPTTFGKKYGYVDSYDPIEIIKGLEYETVKPYGEEYKFASMPYYGF